MSPHLSCSAGSSCCAAPAAAWAAARAWLVAPAAAATPLPLRLQPRLQLEQLLSAALMGGQEASRRCLQLAGGSSARMCRQAAAARCGPEACAFQCSYLLALLPGHLQAVVLPQRQWHTGLAQLIFTCSLCRLLQAALQRCSQLPPVLPFTGDQLALPPLPAPCATGRLPALPPTVGICHTLALRCGRPTV